MFQEIARQDWLRLSHYLPLNFFLLGHISLVYFEVAILCEYSELIAKCLKAQHILFLNGQCSKKRPEVKVSFCRRPVNDQFGKFLVQWF